MELKYFRLIKTIAEEGSIANSSERLFLTQSALSHQLRDLIEASHFSAIHLFINSFPLEGVFVYENFLRPHKITPKKISAIPFTEITLALIETNMGIMCAPKWQLKSFKLSDNVVFKRIGKDGLKRNHYLVLKAVNRNKKYIHDFISSLEDDFLE